MFDPYHKWLGIPPGQRPPAHYQLLGISPDEQDLEVIAEAAIRQTAHLRTYQSGQYAAECQQLLEEVAQARLVLSDPAKRKAYDATLSSSKKMPAAAVVELEIPPSAESEAFARPRTVRRKRRRAIPWTVYAGIIFIPTIAIGIIAAIMMSSKPARTTQEELAENRAPEASRPLTQPAVPTRNTGKGAADSSAAEKGSDSPRDMRPPAFRFKTPPPSSDLPTPTPPAPEPSDSDKMDLPEPAHDPSLAPERQKQMREWAKALIYGEDDRRIKVCREIALAGPEAKSLGRTLCRIATDKSAKVRQAAVEAMEKVRPDLGKHLAVLIARDTIRVHDTLGAIFQMGEQASDLIPVFVFDFTLAKAPKGNEKYIADIAGPLARIGGGEEEIVRLLISGYKSQNGVVRSAVAAALGIVAREHENMRKLVVPALKPALSDPPACAAAATSAKECGYEARELLPALRKVKLARDEAIRKAATEAIDAIERAPEPTVAQRLEPTTLDPEKAAASKLKKAKELLEGEKVEDAREYCEEILKKYPQTKAADEAKEMLAKLPSK